MAAHNTTTQQEAPIKRHGGRRQRGPTDVNLLEDVSEYMIRYARNKPEMAALWCFGIGFILGWKLKPW